MFQKECKGQRLIDLEKTSIRFSDVQELFGKLNQIMSAILGHTQCLVTIAEINTTEDIFQLVDLVSGIRVPKKHLLLIGSELDVNLLLKSKINFDIQILDTSTGNSKIEKTTFRGAYMQYNSRWRRDKEFLSCSWKRASSSSQWSVPLAFTKSTWKKAQHLIHWLGTLYSIQANHWWERF